MNPPQAETMNLEAYAYYGSKTSHVHNSHSRLKIKSGRKPQIIPENRKTKHQPMTDK